MKITEKHYNPHVKSSQWELEAEVRKCWSNSETDSVKKEKKS